MQQKPSNSRLFGTTVATLAMISAAGCAHVKSPIERSKPTCSERLAGESQMMSIQMVAADGRSVPTEIHFPAAAGRYPLIGFSHGALAAPDRYHSMVAPISAAGYVVVVPMHLESEEFKHETVPSAADIWRTRVEDLALALNPPEAVRVALSERGIEADSYHVVAMGHSFGALMAAIAGGANANDAKGQPTPMLAPPLDGVVAWSPPGAMPGVIEKSGWAGLNVPTLILTGTADALKLFQQDWQWHTEVFAAIPPGAKSLWIGEGVDHYFGGNFGRERAPDENSNTMFARAMAVTVQFLDMATKRPDRCDAAQPITGERLRTH